MYNIQSPIIIHFSEVHQTMKKSNHLAKELHRLDIGVGRVLCQSLSGCGMEEVSGTNGRIIRFLSDHEDNDVYQRDLEKEFGITRSTASRVLTLMEQKGLIIRSGVSHDARLKKLTLTEKARGFSDVMRRNAEKVNRQLLEGFSKDEIERLCQYIERMQQNITGKN